MTNAFRSLSRIIRLLIEAGYTTVEQTKPRLVEVQRLIAWFDAPHDPAHRYQLKLLLRRPQFPPCVNAPIWAH
jgi:hypothetical protein